MMKMGRFTAVCISIDKEQLQKLDELCARKGITRSEFAQKSIKDRMENDCVSLIDVITLFKKHFYDEGWRKNNGKK